MKESAGITTINTSRLLVSDGGLLSTSTLNQGSAGSLIVNASDSVEVSGKQEGQISQIGSDAQIQPEIFRQALGLPDRPSGDSGNLTINTPQLTISDAARVSVANEGTGIAGNMQLNASSNLLLDTEGEIIATTASGEGGNINLATEFLQLRGNSQISTESGGTGNGGNMNLNADTIVALSNSDITANAFEGNGGNIQIATQGIFGTEFRPQQTPESDITASSQFGVAGNVSISTPDVDPNSGLLQLPENPIDPNQKLVSGCLPFQGSSFTVTGRGGIPSDPTDFLQSPVVWHRLRSRVVPPVANRDSSINLATFSSESNQSPLMEATGWVVNDSGQVELVSSVPSQSSWYRDPQCGDGFESAAT